MRVLVLVTLALGLIAAGWLSSVRWPSGGAGPSAADGRSGASTGQGAPASPAPTSPAGGAPGPASEARSRDAGAPAEGPPPARTLGARLAALTDEVDRAGLLALIRELRAALAERPGDALLHMQLGEALRLAGETEPAVEHARRAVELAPESGRASFLLAKALGETMRAEGVLTAMSLLAPYRRAVARALELDPDHVAARAERIGFLAFAPGLLGGDLEEAKQEARALCETHPAWGWLMLALAHDRDDELTEALDAARRGVEAAPDDQKLRTTLAGLLEDAGRHDEAEAAYAAALEGPRSPAWYMALFRRAARRIERVEDRLPLPAGHLAEAAADLRTYLSDEPYGDLLPSPEAARGRLGQALVYLDRPDEARPHLEAALAADPDDDDVRELLEGLADG